MPWYEEFFDEDYMRFHLCGGEEQWQRAPAECDFVISALNLRPGDRILDLCCGQGRHSVELARRGFRVTGLDLSEYLLGLAKAAAREAGVEAEFVRRDMRDLPWQEEFDAVLNLWTAFGYLECNEEDQRVLEAVSRALRPGGRLIMDLTNRDRAAGWRAAWRDWREHDGYLILDEHSYDVLRGRETATRVIVGPNGLRRQKGYVLRIYAHSEIMAMLTQSGLEWLVSYGSYDGLPYDMTSRRMLVIARKPMGEREKS